MSAGLPGLGLGGLFFIFSALLAPFPELWRTLRGRSDLGSWKTIGRQLAQALVMVASIDLTLRLTYLVLAAVGVEIPRCRRGDGPPPEPDRDHHRPSGPRSLQREAGRAGPAGARWRASAGARRAASGRSAACGHICGRRDDRLGCAARRRRFAAQSAGAAPARAGRFTTRAGRQRRAAAGCRQASPTGPERPSPDRGRGHRQRAGWSRRNAGWRSPAGRRGPPRSGRPLTGCSRAHGAAPEILAAGRRFGADRQLRAGELAGAASHSRRSARARRPAGRRAGLRRGRPTGRTPTASPRKRVARHGVGELRSTDG